MTHIGFYLLSDYTATLKFRMAAFKSHWQHFLCYSIHYPSHNHTLQ